MLLKRWPAGAASGGCRGRIGESRGWGPVWERGKKTLTIVVSVIISKPQLVDFASSAFISKLRLICFTRLQRNVLPRVNYVYVCVCVRIYWTIATMPLSLKGHTETDWAPCLWRENGDKFFFYAQTLDYSDLLRRYRVNAQKWRGRYVYRLSSVCAW